ncbi:MAG: hypothetical protein HY040_13750 [Planctomycetes bacterium]|nr:hypothetical protein [Planctomycetota bacterium]
MADTITTQWKYVCPACQKPVRAARELPADMPVKCPGCAKLIVFRRANAEEEEILVFDVEIVEIVEGYDVRKQTHFADIEPAKLKKKRAREEQPEIDAPRLPSWFVPAGLAAIVFVVLLYAFVFLF